MANNTKRLILCCDGTWMDRYVKETIVTGCELIAKLNSDNGFSKPTLVPYVPTGTLQVPSNITRISRALEKIGRDGKPQIISYHSGVGSTTGSTITGGLLGTGI